MNRALLLEQANHLRANGFEKPVEPQEMQQYPMQLFERRDIPVRSGAVTVYVYRAEEAKPNMPACVVIHGGGYTKPHADRDELFCRKLAAECGCVVFDIDHPLSPEYPYPIPVEACADAAQWFYQHAGEFSVDPPKIAILGYSSGGSLAAATVMLGLQQQAFSFCQLIMMYPLLDNCTDPDDKPKPPYAVAVERARLFRDFYLSCPEDGRQPLASPALAQMEQLQGFPPTFLLTAEYDALREEAERFAVSLSRAGVQTTLMSAVGQKHAFLVRRDEGYEPYQKLIEQVLANALGTAKQ